MDSNNYPNCTCHRSLQSWKGHPTATTVEYHARLNVYTSSGKRSCLAQWSISHIPLCCSGGVRSRRILILISLICWFQPPAQHGLSIFATTSAFSVFHPASGWTSGWMMVVEAMTCLCQWSVHKADRKRRVSGSAMLSCHVKIHIASPKQIKKRIPSQSMFHKCWCLDMRRHLEARRTPQMWKKGLVRWRQRCFKKGRVGVPELGPTPPGAVRVASRTPGQFESARAGKQTCQHFETSDVFFSTVC